MRETPSPEDPRKRTLVLTLCALFIGFYVTSNLIGAKLFSFTLFGLAPRHLGLGDGDSFVATAGILAFPLTFILTDVINEYFGRAVVRVFTILGIAVSLLLQPVVLAAMAAPTVVFPGMVPPTLAQVGQGDQATAHAAFAFAFGNSWAIVIASLTAFLVGQFLDIWVFTRLRRLTGGRMLWLRAQGSTLVSQVVDTFVVIFLAFVIIPALAGGSPWPVGSAFSVSVTNYVYKFAIALAITPLLYVAHAAIDRWLGARSAEEMIREAHPVDPA